MCVNVQTRGQPNGWAGPPKGPGRDGSSPDQRKSPEKVLLGGKRGTFLTSHERVGRPGSVPGLELQAPESQRPRLAVGPGGRCAEISPRTRRPENTRKRKLVLETSTAPHPTVLRAFTSSHRAPKPKVLPRTGVRTSAQTSPGVEGRTGGTASPVSLGSRWTAPGWRSSPDLRAPRPFRPIVEASLRKLITARSLKFHVDSASKRLISHGRCTRLTVV